MNEHARTTRLLLPRPTRFLPAALRRGAFVSPLLLLLVLFLLGLHVPCTARAQESTAGDDQAKEQTASSTVDNAQGAGQGATSGSALSEKTSRSSAPSEKASRVIVLGFDGVDPDRCREYFQTNNLPHLRDLAQQGTFSDLTITYPAQSPVSWASFMTSQNPGYHGIYDFLYRLPHTYTPDIALTKRVSEPLLPSKIARGLLTLAMGIIALLFVFGLARLFRAPSKAALIVALIFAIPTWVVSYTAFYRWLPYELPKPESRRTGTPFWNYAAAAGQRVKAIDIPLSFPAVEVDNVHLTTGLGTPDARATWGIFALYSTQQFESTASETGGVLTTVKWEGDTASAEILGPTLVPSKGDQRIPLNIERTGEDSVILRVSGLKIPLKVGEWSDFATLTFKANPLIKMMGTTRFKLLELNPALRLYQEPLNFHACDLPPTVNISTPRNWACELAKEYGERETVGWSIATNPLRDNVIDIDSFLEDLNFTLEHRKKVILSELAKDDWDLFIGIFLSTDRMQHMMYRFIDPGHPNYDAELAKKYGGEILSIYQKMDAIVGEVMDKYLDDDTVMMVVSDHGFHSYRYGVNLNTWLVKNGFMDLEGPLGGEGQYKRLEDLFDPEGSFYKNVNWSKTKAYCMGLGSIYINLQLREPQGSVSAVDYDAVRQEIIDGLLKLEDPRFPGRPVVLDVVRRDDVYHGPRFLEAPDLLVCFNENYRVSWQTSLGGIPPEVIEDNIDNWSGDHCSYDPRITKGIFFSSRKLPGTDPNIMDVGPTVLRYLGVALPKDFDGKTLQTTGD